MWRCTTWCWRCLHKQYRELNFIIEAPRKRAKKCQKWGFSRESLGTVLYRGGEKLDFHQNFDKNFSYMKPASFFRYQLLKHLKRGQKHPFFDPPKKGHFWRFLVCFRALNAPFKAQTQQGCSFNFFTRCRVVMITQFALNLLNAGQAGLRFGR